MNPIVPLAVILGLLVIFVIFLCVFFLTMTLGDALIAGCQKLRHQRKMFKLAKAKAQKTGKKLLVIGDPQAPGTINAIFRTYGCGDICIDLHGCSKCEQNTEIMRMDLLQALQTLSDNSVVIYESETLEYINCDFEKLQRLIDEMKRVSGNDMFATHFVGLRIA